MHKRPIISFCIPTYNRGDNVFDLVTSILKYQGNEIEVVVLDNLSTDNTGALLKNISDPRFFYKKNEINIGGIKNLCKVLTLAGGEFCFLCLDKDFIRHEYIDELIKRINADKNLVFGYCTLNKQDSGSDIAYEKGFESIYNMVYLSAHPTGMFYRTDLYKKLPIVSQILTQDVIFGFNSELINADMSLLGKSKIINLPIFQTEKAEACASVATFTYLKESDVFFFPTNRLNEFSKYSSSLFSLALSEKEKFMILKKIFIRGLFSASFGFKDAIGNRNICEHYRVKSRKIGSINLIKLGFLFCKNFLNKDLPISVFNKIFLFAYGNFRIIFSIIRSKFRKITN